jgi:S-formylglutathione hydrolase FrmB
VIVLPQGSLGFWENWVDGSRLYRDWVMRDLLPVVRERYHTRPCPDGCHIVGISMGGHGALRFALLEPGAFASVSAISAPVLDSERMADFGSRFWVNVFVPVERIWGDPEDREKIESQDLFLVWTGPQDLNGVHILLAWGHHDLPGIATSSEAFHAHLEKHGIPHEAAIFDGSHDWNSWKPVLERVLRVQLADDASGPSPARIPDRSEGQTR